MQQRYITTKEAAKILGISYKTLEKGRCGYGKIAPPYVRIGRTIRYSTDELLTYINERANGPKH